MKVMSVVGARPQFVKAAVVSRAISESGSLEERLVHTGQHYDVTMSDVFFNELEIPAPAVRMEIGSGSHGAQTAAMLEGIETQIITTSPDVVLIYGDTNSTLAAALAAAKLHVPIAHVEAGLRSFDKRMPEEVNRILADHVSDLLLAPTDNAQRNLRDEGITEGVHVVGDVMLDAARIYGKLALESSTILADLELVSKEFVLVTVHRAQNTDDPNRLGVIVSGLNQAANRHRIVLPLHPRTRGALDAAGLELSSEIVIVEPLGYLDMTRLEMAAALVVTDSGGVQKEAFFHRTPCLTLRDETEWVELVDSGWNSLVALEDPAVMVSAIEQAWGSEGDEVTPYGDGHAAELIVDLLCGF